MASVSILFLIGEFFNGASVHKVQGDLAQRFRASLGLPFHCRVNLHRVIDNVLSCFHCFVFYLFFTFFMQDFPVGNRYWREIIFIVLLKDSFADLITSIPREKQGRIWDLSLQVKSTLNNTVSFSAWTKILTKPTALIVSFAAMSGAIGSRLSKLLTVETVSLSQSVIKVYTGWPSRIVSTILFLVVDR